MSLVFPLTDSLFFLPGPAGKLEVLTTMPKKNARPITAIISHPHPLYAGTMQNKVVTTLAKAMEELGIKTVRFNFRGVGKSEGVYDNAIGETDDLNTIVAWAKKVNPSEEIWLAGFSFGAHISTKVANEDTDIKQLITIAPSVNTHDFTAFKNVTCPWLFVIGEEDELVPLEAVKAFISKAPVPIKFISLPETSHFFHGKLLELRTLLITQLLSA